MWKQIAGIALASSALFSNDVVYFVKEKPVYLDATSGKVVGKLLPTNAVEILAQEGDRIKFKITGYQNKATPNVIYFTDKARIFSLAFAKNITPVTQIVESKDQWNTVTTEAYTTKGDFEKELQPMMERAAKLYSDNCSMCHTLNAVDHFTANQWPSTFRSMLDRTPIQKDDVWLVTQYLQKNASDMKK
ncbi:MAG: cytochrome C [Epsilonproteobacteria bacterium]|uniref:cytochrome C n=1 Tax=Sulfurospirillum cavolei TaxID=366522 RepID=UPI003FA2B6F6|nr:cytochrome C [Campylobacterota bacterium]